MEQKICMEKLLAQEETLVFPHFNREDAYTLGQLIVQHGKTNGLKIAVMIELCGIKVFQYVGEGMSKQNVDWLALKRNTALQYDHSSLYMRLDFSASSRSCEKERLDPICYGIAGGAVPIRVKGIGSVGTVVVSGLKDTEDHDLVVESLKELLSSMLIP